MLFNFLKKNSLKFIVAKICVLLLISTSSIAQVRDTSVVRKGLKSFSKEKTPVDKRVPIDTSIVNQLDSTVMKKDTSGTVIDSISTVDSIKIKKKWPKVKRVWHSNIDSSAVHYIYTLSDRYHSFYDTALHQSIYEEDLAKRNGAVFLHLGNTGSSATPLLFQLRDDVNKDIGLHQYDLYNEQIDSFKQFIVYRPYSHAYFYTGTDKNNFSTGIKYANQYAGDVHLNIDFKRINSVGLYKEQKTKHSDLKTSVFWNHNRYQLFVLFYNRTNTEQLNGGVVAGQQLDTVFNRIRTNVFTQLSNTNTRHYQSGLKLTNKYDLLNRNSFGINLYHQVNYRHNLYKYSDVDIALDSTYYKQLWKDRRGVRFLLDQKTWSNEVGVILSNSKYFRLNTRLRHQNVRIENDYFQEKTNIVDLIGDADFSIGRWQNKGYLQFNIAGLENNSIFKFESVIDFGKHFGRLSATYKNIRQSANYIQQNLILNNDLVWKNSYDIQFSNSLGVSYNNIFTRTKVSLSTTFLNKHIYYDSALNLVQDQSTLNIRQFTASQGFKLGNVYTLHEVSLQESPEHIFSLPSLYTKHDIHWNYKLKSSNKEIRIGSNFKYYKSDRMIQYQGALGTFYPSMTVFDDYWSVDAYVAMKISSLRFYIKYQNLDQLLDRKVDFQVLQNPQADNIVLFGINWIMYD